MRVEISADIPNQLSLSFFTTVFTNKISHFCGIKSCADLAHYPELALEVLFIFNFIIIFFQNCTLHEMHVQGLIWKVVIHVGHPDVEGAESRMYWHAKVCMTFMYQPRTRNLLIVWSRLGGPSQMWCQALCICIIASLLLNNFHLISLSASRFVEQTRPSTQSLWPGLTLMIFPNPSN